MFKIMKKSLFAKICFTSVFVFAQEFKTSPKIVTFLESYLKEEEDTHIRIKSKPLLLKKS